MGVALANLFVQAKKFPYIPLCNEWKQGFPQSRSTISKSAVENVSRLSKSLPTHFPSSTVLSLLVSVLHSVTGAIDACAYAIARIDNARFVP